MANEIKYTLNVQTADNPLTKDTGDSIFVLVSNGTADFDRLVSEMMSVNPGFEREIVEAVLKLEQRTIMKLTLNGMRVNTGLFSAVAMPKGRGGASWNPDVNSLKINLTQGGEWREAIQATNVNVLGQKADVMYIGNMTDVATKAENFTASPGYPLTLTGNYLRVEGDDPGVGIFLVDEDGEETRVDERYIVVNDPKRLSFVVPAGLADGTYTLRVVTQSSSNTNKLLKTPRMAETTVYIGVAPDTGSGTGGSTTPGGSGTGGNDDGDHQLG